MSAQPQPSPDSSNKEEELYQWRKDILIELGFESVQAGALARKGVDHHQVRKMMAQGCTKDLVCGILL